MRHKTFIRERVFSFVRIEASVPSEHYIIVSFRWACLTPEFLFWQTKPELKMCCLTTKD